MSSRPLTRWLFGKLPAHGDFLSRGLDFGLRDALDHWLTGEIEAARDRLGASFDDRWFTAPAWNFVDCDGCGQWSGGALCASLDSAGRKFPVILAAPAADAHGAGEIAAGCLGSLYSALSQRWEADQLHSHTIEPIAAGWSDSQPAWALVSEDGAAMIEQGRFPDGIVLKMLEMTQ